MPSRCKRKHGYTRPAAAHTLPVLVEGETGTGKELAAHAIHRLSDCSDGPFVWMNCASIPAELIDAELFGYEGGAFTGARARGKPGKFELAKGGTLFLDEIGDMPLHLQSSLLRAVQSGEIVSVGGTSPIQIETRIICATNRPLSDLVDKGTFRPDLFYRLDVFQIAMPSLRDRSDKEEFIDVLLSRISHRQGIAPPPLTASAKAQLIQHDWPGNVRELESVLMRFVITGKIKVSQLKETRHLPSYSETAKAESLPHNSLGLKSRLLQEKNRAIEEALRKTGDDKNRAAAFLGISRAQLYREIGRIHDDSDAP